MNTGIYCIKNKENGKMYIGSSFNIEKRWADHLYMLKENKHHSIHLQRAWNKYGIDNFSFEILELCDISDLLVREQYYFDLYLKADEYINGISDYFVQHSYNICPLSIKGFTGKQSRETILKILNSRGLSELYKIDINGNIIAIYDMINDTGDARGPIWKSIKNKQTLQGKDYGYIRASNYVEGYKPKKTEVWNKGIKSPTHKGNNVYCYDIYGRFFKEFRTQKEAADYFNMTSASICIKMNKMSKRLSSISDALYYIFSNTPINMNNIIQISNTGNIEVYTVFNELIGLSSIEELTKILKVNPFSIREVLAQRRKQIKYYILKYREDIV